MPDENKRMTGSDLIKNGEIILTGPVLDDDWCQWREGSCFSALMVRDALGKFSGDVTVRLNSGGGDPYEGESIRSAIAGHQGRVSIIVEGIAASAASLLLMGADDIEMSAGSMIMIHDPSSVVIGNEAEMLREASRLSQLAEVYASVYAARSGQEQGAVRELMREETWFGPDEALAAGFTDTVLAAKAKTGMTLKAAKMEHGTAVAALKSCFEHFKKPSSAMSAAINAGVTSSTPAEQAVSMEGNMPKTNPNQPAPKGDPAPIQTTVAPAPPAALVDTQAVTDDAIKMERQRQRDIRAAAAPFMANGSLMSADVEKLIDEGVAPDVACTRMMASMADKAPLAPARVAGAQDQNTTTTEAMIGALMHSVAPGAAPLEGAAMQFRGIRLKNLAMNLAGQTRGFNEHENIRAGMRSTAMMGGAHGVSDFAYITTEVMNRTLRAAYAKRAHTWQMISRRRSAADFREMHSVRFGGDFELQAKDENGEYKQATISDEAEGLKVTAYGRALTLTFEAIINDDLGVFETVPLEFARSASTLEAKIVWAIIRANAVMKSDSKALFHADHNNLAGGSGAISVTTVGAGRKAMWEQRAFGTKDTDEFIEASPNLLIVPPALETVAGQFVAAVTPAKTVDANPFQASVSPLVVPNLGAAAGGSDASWYLADSDLPPIEHAYLEGYEGPTITRSESMNPDNVAFNARHIFGAAPVEHRGVYKNP